MCLGVPMVVEEGGPFAALCRRGTMHRTVAMALVGDQPPGTRVLVHVDTAIRVLEADEAAAIDGALAALEAAMAGEPFDHLLGDLADREPLLPAHLRA